MVKETNYYIDGDKLTVAVDDYSEKVNFAKLNNQEEPDIPKDVYMGIIKICEKLSSKSNFSGYTYREDMVMDAIENCIKALKNGKFNSNAPTKSGNPTTAFKYFTMIAFYAMVRRIKAENKVLTLKRKIKETATPFDFVVSDDNEANHYIEQLILDNLKE